MYDKNGGKYQFDELRHAHTGSEAELIGYELKGLTNSLFNRNSNMPMYFFFLEAKSSENSSSLASASVTSQHQQSIKS